MDFGLPASEHYSADDEASEFYVGPLNEYQRLIWLHCFTTVDRNAYLPAITS